MKPAISAYKKNARTFLAAGIFMIFFSSCYSVRFVNKDGVWEPDPLNNSRNFYKGKMMHVIDTTVNLKILENEISMIERCPSGGFYSFEYRVTFGGVLLSAITFGKKRQVKIKYVCTK